MRMNISVPDALKTRMDAARDEATNWSQVACRAFEIELGGIASRKKEKTMSDVVQRLRASKLEAEQEEAQLGYEAGREWAKNRAEFSALKRLAEQEALLMPYMAWTLDLVLQTVMGAEAWENEDREAALEQLGVESDDLASDFVAGALSVLDEVSDQL